METFSKILHFTHCGPMNDQSDRVAAKAASESLGDGGGSSGTWGGTSCMQTSNRGWRPFDRQPVMGYARRWPPLGCPAIHSNALMASRLSTSRLLRPKLVEFLHASPSL